MRSRAMCCVRASLILAGMLALGGGSSAMAGEVENAAPDRTAYETMVSRGVEYLRNSGQASDGSFSRQAGPGVTAIVTTAVLRHGRSPDDPLVADALQYLEAFVRADGGIYVLDSRHANYETSLAMLCFSEANRDGRYDALLKAASSYLRGLQWDEEEEKDESDFYYGGAGYGGHKRPDLSNTQFFVDALRTAGASADDPAIQKALLFVSRCQNLETEHNTTPFSAKINDGGFYYTPAAGGTSQAGETPDGGLRSYGSMTYAGLKSMIFAGVTADDPRVEAAVEWIRRHYDLESNPGMGDAGLYYYYHTFAKALTAMKFDEFVDDDGQRHDWRKELSATLAERQRADGSWINENSRWLEGDPNLVTGYALLCLSYCRPETAQ